MKFSAENIPYAQTKAFSSIVTDYVAAAASLKPFYQHTPTLDGIKAAIQNSQHPIHNRAVLVNTLQSQYSKLPANEKVQANVDLLLLENTFTITTAHQPNIFTGHLYFIYKILHAIKLAETLSNKMPDYHFVPVYYMGSEDADLEELGQVTVAGKKYEWETKQKGAVGRMTIDRPFLEMIQAIEGQINVAPFGKEIMEIINIAYTIGKKIEQATLEMVHALFAKFGLIIVLPDDADLKRLFISVIEKELTEQFSHQAVKETMANFPEQYKVQTMGRELNLFYLKDDIRERIEYKDNKFAINNTELVFDSASIVEELDAFPERFSPNVILRPVFQGTILPDIAFIGGGGELAYWLELQKVFAAAAVPYPVLVLRNSFLLVNHQTTENIVALGLQVTDFFKPLHLIQLQLVQQASNLQLDLTKEKQQLHDAYFQIKKVASIVDPTLAPHTEALLKAASKKIDQLEKKMIKAEKKKFEAKQRQAEKIKNSLFPNHSLQERVDNIIPYYAQFGAGLIDELFAHSLTLEQEFCILNEQP